MSTPYIPSSALSITAHPDDIEFSCVGTLARWARYGCKVVYVLCTSGDAGIEEPGMTRARATEIREAESLAAAKIAGAHEVVFLRHPDGMLEATMELRRQLVREIRRFKPEVVMTGDPTIVWASEDYINHPDHRAAALAAVDAIFPAAGNPMVYPEMETEGILPHRPRKVYVHSWSGASEYVNISETIDIKVAALKAHKSQMKDWDPTEPIRTWARDAGRGKEMEFAESFRVVSMMDDAAWEKLNPK